MTSIEAARKDGDLARALWLIREDVKAHQGHMTLAAGHQYALILLAQERYAEAAVTLTMLAAKLPENAQVRYQLGQCAELVGEYTTAKDHYRQATKLYAKDDSQPDACRAWFGLGSCLYRLGRPDEGEAAWLIGLDNRCDSPDARFQRSNVLLALGRYAEGWQDYEARLEMRGVKDSLKARGVNLAALPPAWDGQAQGRVMVLGTQGAGDCIQFSRYLPIVAQRSGFTPYLIAGEPLASFLGYNVPFGCDYSVYLDSLPKVLGMPEPIAPVHPTTLRPYGWWTNERPRVGVCWHGNPSHRNDLDRSSPIDFREAFASDRYEVMSLQVGEGFAPIDYKDTASVLMTLDAVVTVDTSVFHVAGTLGVPTILIPPTAPEYRHGLRGDRSPWYPSVRIVRRRRWDEWPDAITRAQNLLLKML